MISHLTLDIVAGKMQTNLIWSDWRSKYSNGFSPEESVVTEECTEERRVDAALWSDGDNGTTLSRQCLSFCSSGGFTTILGTI
jgi:hypothetical protein